MGSYPAPSTITGEFVALLATIGADGTFSGVMGAGSQATQGTLRGTIAGGVGVVLGRTSLWAVVAN